MRRSTSVLLSAASLAACSSAQAWVVRARFVERVGTTDVVLPNNEISTGGTTQIRNIRLQLGIFDDANGPAPAGGLYGMVDTIETNLGGLVVRRNPGRLPAFAYPADGNGAPADNPFRELTNIDALVGPQTIAWNCSGSVAGPQPAAVVRGRNTFVSVWSISIGETIHCLGLARTAFTGNVLAASQWNVDGTPVQPVCDPPTPGSVTYAPTLLAGAPFNVELRIIVGGGPFFCPADWNFDHSVDSTDFFAFLSAFFNGLADANCNSETNSEDFFYFITQFFSNCHA